MSEQFDPAAKNRELHPVGSIRYCGQAARGSEHCRCLVVGHKRYKIELKRLSSGATFGNYGMIYTTFEELQSYQRR